jgi:hypothetical protein
MTSTAHITPVVSSPDPVPVATSPMISSEGARADADGDLPGTRAMTDMGWGPEKTWPYRILPRDLYDAEFRRHVRTHTYLGGRASSVTLQPHNPDSNQDRFAVDEWALPGGVWTFAAVFDGGKYCVAVLRQYTKAEQDMAREVTLSNTCSRPCRNSSR